MENLHLKNLNRKDIIDDCIKLKEAADENNDEKIEYYRKIPEKTRYFNAEMNQIWNIVNSIYSNKNHLKIHKNML